MCKARDLTAVDMAIGTRIHEARLAAGLSQILLAEKTGVSRQQIQKYEYGEDRITAGRLKAMAEILDVPIMFFFKELEEIIQQPMKQALALQAAQSFRKINNPEVQKEILVLLEVLNSKEI